MIMYYYYFVLNDYCTLLYTISTVRMVYNLLTTYIRTILIIYALEGTTMNIYTMSCAFMYCMVVVIVWTLYKIIYYIIIYTHALEHIKVCTVYLYYVLLYFLYYYMLFMINCYISHDEQHSIFMQIRIRINDMCPLSGSTLELHIHNYTCTLQYIEYYRVRMQLKIE